MTPRPTTFERALAFGSIGEGKIARWLMARGTSILPIYELEVDTGKGPRIFAPDTSIIAPDMLAMTTRGTFWIEAKHKTVFSWHRKSQRWVTGIDLHHYRNYLNVADRYPWKVWLLFLHARENPDMRDVRFGCPEVCPVGLFGGELMTLRMVENHRHANHGRTGMVYWAHDSLKKLASLEDVVAASEVMQV